MVSSFQITYSGEPAAGPDDEYPYRREGIPVTARDLGSATLAIIVITLAACTGPAPASVPERSGHLEGRVIERLDAPPYSFLHLETPDGSPWVALPLTAALDPVVRIENAVLVRNHRIGSAGRTLDVYFGRLASKPRGE
jgi:hypothetical protein